MRPPAAGRVPAPKPQAPQGALPRPRGEVPSLVNRALALADTDRMAALRLLEDYLASPPKDPEVAVWALLWAGEQRRLGGDEPAARRWFERVAATHPTHPLNHQ